MWVVNIYSKSVRKETSSFQYKYQLEDYLSEIISKHGYNPNIDKISVFKDGIEIDWNIRVNIL